MSERLIVGDPHAKKSNLDKINRLLSTVESYGLPTVFMGDLLDTKDIISGQCLNVYLDYFKSSKLQHNILVGNHDYFSKECDRHSLEALKLLPNVHVIDQPYFDGKSLFLPYYHDINEFRQIISHYELPPYLFCHLDVIGMDYGNGFISESGATLEDLKQFDKVISGHYHKYASKENLTYIGSPFSHDFAESNQIKYLGIFDDSNGQLELIETDFPKHVTVELDLSKGSNLEVNPNNYNRVILTGTIDEIKAFDKSVYPSVRFIEKTIENLESGNINEALSPIDIYKEWYFNVKKNTDEQRFIRGLDLIK